MSATCARFTATLSRELGDHSRPLFTLLRWLCPVIATRRFGVVTRADDVREVLADFAHFGVPAYNEKMSAISGPFILGLDDTPLYRHDHQALRAAIRREDADELAQRTLSTARDRLRMIDGQVDVVGQFADLTIDAVMSDYFGTPGPGTATQLRWARDIFNDVFLNVAAARGCARSRVGRRGRDASPPRRADRGPPGEARRRPERARRRAHAPAAALV